MCYLSGMAGEAAEVATDTQMVQQLKGKDDVRSLQEMTFQSMNDHVDTDRLAGAPRA